MHLRRIWLRLMFTPPNVLAWGTLPGLLPRKRNLRLSLRYLRFPEHVWPRRKTRRLLGRKLPLRKLAVRNQPSRGVAMNRRTADIVVKGSR